MTEAAGNEAVLPPVAGAETLKELRQALPSFRQKLLAYRIAVVCGGDTSEREVSLVSGNEIFKALRIEGFDVELVDIDYSALDAGTFAPFDVLFLALHGGRGEDGTLQGYLDCIGQPYVSASPAASAIGMKKPLFKRIAQALGLKTPAFAHLLSDDEIPHALEQLAGDRIVVKPASEGSSVGVEIVERAQAGEAATRALHEFGEILVEDYIDGPELTVSIIGKRLQPVVLPHVQIAPVAQQFYDYKAKYTKGETNYIIPARINDELTAKLAEQASTLYRAIDFSPYVRMDAKLDAAGNIYFLEANTLPGFTALSLVPQAAAACGISYTELLLLLLYLALETRL